MWNKCTCCALNKFDAECVEDDPPCKACSANNLSCNALFDKLSGDLDELLVSAVCPNGWDSGGIKEEWVDGIGDNRDADIAGDARDDIFDEPISFSLKDGVTPLEAGLSKLPSLEVFTRIAAAAAAAATLAVWDLLPDNDVETPLLIVTLDPVGDGIDL